MFSGIPLLFLWSSEWSSGFPYFLQFKPEFCNNKLMIWATVSSRSCFCWLCSFYIFGCKEYNQFYFCINPLVISTCRLGSCIVGRGFSIISVLSWQNSISPCPASFCTPRPNVPVTPGISWHPMCAFQSPMMKRTSFSGGISRRSCRSS